MWTTEVHRSRANLQHNLQTRPTKLLHPFPPRRSFIVPVRKIFRLCPSQVRLPIVSVGSEESNSWTIKTQSITRRGKRESEQQKKKEWNRFNEIQFGRIITSRYFRTRTIFHFQRKEKCVDSVYIFHSSQTERLILIDLDLVSTVGLNIKTYRTVQQAKFYSLHRELLECRQHSAAVLKTTGWLKKYTCWKSIRLIVDFVSSQWRLDFRQRADPCDESRNCTARRNVAASWTPIR